MSNRNQVRFKADRLLGALKALDVNAEYFPADFSNPKEPVHATITLTTSREIANRLIGQMYDEDKRMPDRMIGEINCALYGRYDSNSAYLRRIDYQTEGDKIFFSAEIVPSKKITGMDDGRDLRVIATEKFLRGLTSIILNFKQKNPTR